MVVNVINFLLHPVRDVLKFDDGGHPPSPQGVERRGTGDRRPRPPSVRRCVSTKTAPYSPRAGAGFSVARQHVCYARAKSQRNNYFPVSRLRAGGHRKRRPSGFFCVFSFRLWFLTRSYVHPVRRRKQLAAMSRTLDAGHYAGPRNQLDSTKQHRVSSHQPATQHTRGPELPSCTAAGCSPAKQKQTTGIIVVRGAICVFDSLTRERIRIEWGRWGAQ